MNYICSIFLPFLFIGFAFGNDSDNDDDFSYSFKDKIHSMVSGHHHLDDIELQEICNRFPDYFSDILELQSEPPDFQTERYITNLTSLVIFSDTLTKDQKQTFYRRSYQQALEAREKGDEWKWLLGILVERTDALTFHELEDLMSNTTHEPMKPLIENAIDRMERRSRIRTRPSEQESSEQLALQTKVEKNQASNDKRYEHLPWIIAGAVFLGIILFLLKKQN